MAHTHMFKLAGILRGVPLAKFTPLKIHPPFISVIAKLITSICSNYLFKKISADVKTLCNDPHNTHSMQFFHFFIVECSF